MRKRNAARKCERVGVVGAAAMLALSAVLAAAPIDKPIEKPIDKKAATSSTKPTTSTKPGKNTSTAVIVRTKLKLDVVETELTDLLAAGQKEDPRVTGLKVSYRMVMRRLYEAAAAAKTDEVRAVLALRADKLLDGAAAFDTFAAQAIAWRTLAAKQGSTKEEVRLKASLEAAIKAMGAFEKATDKVGMEITDGITLRKFQAEMLTPLEPAVLLDNNDVPLPSAWPELPKGGVKAGEMPAPDATLIRLQQVNIMPDLKDELQAVLPKVRDELAAPETAGAAAEQYKVLLDVLGFAEQLGTSQALSLDARTDMNKQLRKSLILFKDSRTRESAMKRLAGVGDVATTLMHLEQSSLDASQKQIVGAAMHQAILKMSVPATAQTSRQMLVSLDRLVTVQGEFTKALDQPTIATARDEWKKIRTAGETLIANIMEKLQTDADTAKVDDTVKRLEFVLRSFEGLASMPGLIRRTEAFKPKPAPGAVDRKMTLWARGIADAPDSNSAAADELRMFGKAVTALENSKNLGSGPEMDPQLIAAIAGDHYGPFSIKATDNAAKLLTGLTTLNTPLAPLITKVESDNRLLRATQAILALQSESVLERLNRWGGWQLDASARTLMVADLTRAVGNAYVIQTGGVPLTDATISLVTAEDALDRILEMNQRLSDKLPQKTTNWGLTYGAVARGPSSRAILVSTADACAVVCLQLNEAACNADNGGSDEVIAADTKLALEMLAAIGLDK